MLIIKLIIAVVLLIGFVFYLFNKLYKRTNHNKNFFENTEKFIVGVPKNLEIVCTGSSYAKFGIDFEQTEYMGFNFGIFPQSLNYDYKLLQQYSTNMKSGCVVLITLAPLVFGFVDYENDSSNYKYYKFLKRKYINNYRFKTKVTHIIFPLLATPRLAKYIFHDVPCIQYDEFATSEEHSRDEAMIRMKGWCGQFQINDLKDYTVTDEMNRIFYKTSTILNNMIKFCLLKDFTPVIVIPPVSNSLYKMFSKEFLDVYLYENIKRCNENITVLNYLGDNELSNYKNYSNSDFMNKLGRGKFTEVLIRDLKAMNLLKNSMKGCTL